MPNSLLDEALELNVNTYVVKLVHLNHPRTDHRKGEMGFILIEGIDENELPISFCVGSPFGLNKDKVIEKIPRNLLTSIYGSNIDKATTFVWSVDKNIVDNEIGKFFQKPDAKNIDILPDYSYKKACELIVRFGIHLCGNDPVGYHFLSNIDFHHNEPITWNSFSRLIESKKILGCKNDSRINLDAYIRCFFYI